jgi:hypothetical protein
MLTSINKSHIQDAWLVVSHVSTLVCGANYHNVKPQPWFHILCKNVGPKSISYLKPASHLLFFIQNLLHHATRGAPRTPKQGPYQFNAHPPCKKIPHDCPKEQIAK